MVHGDCKSVGCYAMTDAYIEEIYILAREAFAAGQTKFHVQALPFRMTASNMQRHRDSPWYPFWHEAQGGVQLLRGHRQAANRQGLLQAVHGECQLHRPGTGAQRGLPGLCQARPRLDTNNRRGSACARGKPWRQGRGYLASGGTAAACDGGKLPDRAVEFASRVRAHGGYVRLAGHFPRQRQSRRDCRRASAEGASRASLFRSRAHLCRGAANRPGTRGGKRGAAGELSGPGSFCTPAGSSRAHSRGCGACAVIYGIDRSDGSTGPECASEAEPLGQGRQAPRPAISPTAQSMGTSSTNTSGEKP